MRQKERILLRKTFSNVNFMVFKGHLLSPNFYCVYLHFFIFLMESMIVNCLQNLLMAIS